MPVRVAVFGAGIAGLSVAHELARLGYAVSVYEAAAEAGGFFRSARAAGNMPSEYSWHGFGPWYHNAFDIMRDIPFGDGHSLFERALCRPIDFGIFPDDTHARFYERGVRQMFQMTRVDLVRWAWLMMKTWASNRRTEIAYSRMNGAARFCKVLTDRAGRTWRASFGPWIGSDWTRVSFHHVGQFFRKQLITWPPHAHAEDVHGPAWSHGSGSGWLLMRGPSSEYWFDRWVAHLGDMGVTFSWGCALERLERSGSSIRRAWLSDGRAVEADRYVVAANPFSVAEIVARSPGLEAEREMRKFRGLVQDGPHVQVSCRIAFAEPVRFPRERTAVVVSDSAFNLTLFAQEQAWDGDVDLGEGVRSLWTVTSCAATVPGRVHGLPVVQCTEAQFVDEVKAQIAACGALDALIREANGGRGFSDLEISRVEVWHEWQFSPEGLQGGQPKWVTTTNTQPWLPSQRTSLSNLFLAGSHTRTEVDVWSIEGAVESGRRAARAIDRRVRVLPQYKPLWLRVLSRIDDLLYAVRAPHVLDVSASALLAATAWGAWRAWRGAERVPPAATVVGAPEAPPLPTPEPAPQLAAGG